MKYPSIIQSKISFDDRGELVHCNNFDFKKNKIRRFYIIENNQINFIRAWHGHKKEEKFIQILNGSIKVCIIKIDDWIKPSKKLKKITHIISSKNPSIIHIPGGYAHGIQTLKKDTRYIVYSNLSLRESLKDDYRYPFNYWDNWQIKFR